MALYKFRTISIIIIFKISGSAASIKRVVSTSVSKLWNNYNMYSCCYVDPCRLVMVS